MVHEKNCKPRVTEVLPICHILRVGRKAAKKCQTSDLENPQVLSKAAASCVLTVPYWLRIDGIAARYGISSTTVKAMVVNRQLSFRKPSGGVLLFAPRQTDEEMGRPVGPISPSVKLGPGQTLARDPDSGLALTTLFVDTPTLAAIHAVSSRQIQRWQAKKLLRPYYPAPHAVRFQPIEVETCLQRFDVLGTPFSRFPHLGEEGLAP